MLNDDDLREILEGDTRPEKVSMLNPLTVLVSSADLICLLEVALSRSPEGAHGKGLTLGASERGRGLELLEWARRSRGQVSLCVYPTEEDGLDALEELFGPPQDEDRDIPPV